MSTQRQPRTHRRRFEEVMLEMEPRMHLRFDEDGAPRTMPTAAIGTRMGGSGVGIEPGDMLEVEGLGRFRVISIDYCPPKYPDLWYATLEKEAQDGKR